jgi:hypothetical protein
VTIRTSQQTHRAVFTNVISSKLHRSREAPRGEEVELMGCGSLEIEIKIKFCTNHDIKYRKRFVSQNQPLNSAAELELRIFEKNEIKNLKYVRRN